MDAEGRFRQAAGDGDLKAMQAVLDSGELRVAFENPDGLSLETLSLVKQIQDASGAGDTSRLKALLDSNPELVNCQWTAQRWSPLSQAVCAKQPAAIDLLVTHGADLDLRYEGGGSALHMAAYTGDVAMLKKVLELGVPLGVTDDNGNTALDDAIEYDRSDAIAYLRDLGAPSRD
jgi:ankyrin repeat protein